MYLIEFIEISNIISDYEYLVYTHFIMENMMNKEVCEFLEQNVLKRDYMFDDDSINHEANM